MEDQHPSANNTIGVQCKIPIIEDEGEDHHQYFDGRRILKVPQHMRFKKHNEEDYFTPKMVSFGPYYHGLPELGTAEEFKHEVLTMFVSSSHKNKQFFYCQIFKVIDQIRNCYVEVSRDAYDDRTLAEMMLLDACFAIYLMKIVLGDGKTNFDFRQHLGMAAFPLVARDMFLLDNQIPLWVINLLIELIGERSMLLCEFLSYNSFADCSRLKRIFGEDEKQPLHLVDASRRIYVQEMDNAGKEYVQPVESQRHLQSKENSNELRKYNRQSRSVTDLKAKGIHFKPSSYCLKNIKFKSYTFYGQLQLPVRLFTASSKLMFIQMLAYEASPESDTDLSVMCYVNFLKSLIVKSEDVKELREKKILFSTLDNDERVAEVIKEIDTYGLDIDHIFYDVKTRIEEHCSSKAKTWIAELIHTYFRNPWTFIALLAATFLLCLTILQTYYTMNS
ncbi:Hypothetical predicted protein [Olea europaea subsp. europaea]|uniref:Uncharacterized protein n=1 Tax=Olea europaea subsp. europaea TaxID=158383 RepID=A0A8S0T703_OLEEU|nr:Hypothetical predicted protein [Olea europaea subsp. europaea]